MKVVRFLARVDEAKCIGDKLCENICPTSAIRVIQKKAKIDEEKCVACRRCWDACQQYAIGMVVRPVPMTLGIDPSDVESARIRELCIKAHLHPQQLICLCSGARVNEAAAAVLKGAKSPEEISLMTGARSGCTLYCLEPMLRLLKAHGIKISPPRGYRWYNITPTLWDIPQEVERRHPGYYFKQDIEIFRKF